MSAPLSEQQLAAIRDRVVLAQDIAGRADWLLSQYKPVRASLADVPALLAEVERLTAQVEATSFDEAAAGAEVEHLKGRITELETERHSTNEALDDAIGQPRVRPAPRPRRFDGVPDAVLEAALRGFVAAHLDYDLHKNLEEPEDDRPDQYPELTQQFAKTLAREAEAAGYEVEPWGGETA